jgi:archaellum component FlaC
MDDRIDDFDDVLSDFKNDVLVLNDSSYELCEDVDRLNREISHLVTLPSKIDELRRNYTNIKIAFRELKEMVWRELKG